MPARRITKVLIANRGEIACRVIRACRELDLRTVAVHSDADAAALHVRLADEAVAIGPPPARESYLRAEKIVDAIKKTGADAVHPGYGFLSENADFAEAVAAAGATFIGPPPAAIRAMGGKTSARALMQAANVPVVPGDNGEGGRGFATPAAAKAAAARVGYPVMLKAAAGGGGRGMRLVDGEDKLEAALAGAQREAKAAFGDDTIYLEKAIVRPRHIEIQVFGDEHGGAVHLYERDCSIQRRNQKVIEESPSPVIDDDTRARMGEVAVRAARSVGYVGAGTIEMLYDAAAKSFYFLEMNTRLQVEHPITELVTGVDLVRWQIAVAQGERIPLAQDAIPRRGAAIECRVYAEDPVKFLPSPGTITSLRVPSGPGVRDDSGVVAGSVISVHYDPMISKLAVWADTRAAAIERMRRALSEYHVGGIRTNLPFHRQVMRHPAFIAGEYDTGFIERHKAELAPAAADDETAMLAAVAAAAQAADRGRGVGEHARPVADATIGVEERPQGLTAEAAGPDSKAASSHSKTLLLVAFATVYVVWGSTYLAIRIAVEHWPPLWLAAVRFAIAGCGLYAVLRLRGAPAPGWRAWLAATVVGGLMLGGGNGTVCWAEQWVPSGETALILSAGPLWTVVLPWIFRRAKAPRPLVALGVVVGLAGVAVLIGGGASGAGAGAARPAVRPAVVARRQPQLGDRIADPAPAAVAEVGGARDGDGDGGGGAAAGVRVPGARRSRALSAGGDHAGRMGGAGVPGRVRQPGGLRVVHLRAGSRGPDARVDGRLRQPAHRGHPRRRGGGRSDGRAHRDRRGDDHRRRRGGDHRNGASLTTLRTLPGRRDGCIFRT